MTVYAKIEYEDFAALVRGKTVEIAGQYPQGTVTVKLILADIGFSKMLATIGDAMVGRVRNPKDEGGQ